MEIREPEIPEIDVVIPTRDRPAQLERCLDSLAEQALSGFRVILVDDGSRTPVADCLPPEVHERHSLLIVRNASSAGPGASRNRGAAAGEAPYLVFLDDDVRAHPELLARHLAVLRPHADPVASIGSLLPPSNRRLPPWDLWQADRLARHHERLARGEAAPSWADLYTGNVALRRADFEAVGGFDVALARQEDIELGYRLSRIGCRFVFEPRAIVWHDADHSLADWLRIPAASARGDALFDRIRPDSGRLRAVREDLARRHWLLRLARRAFRPPPLSRLGVRLAAGAGLALYRAGARRLALPAFSLVWDLEYRRALADATSQPQPSAPSAR